MPHELQDAAARIHAAFPPKMSTDVGAVLQVLPEARFGPSNCDIGPITIGGERLFIPSRIYPEETRPEAIVVLSETQTRILHALYTRHHDGFVRARHLPHVLNATDDWIPPFVVQLIGEYVVEIVRRISENVGTLNPELYSRFATENPAFLRLTRQRVMSYWNEYYRIPYFRSSDYPGVEALKALGYWKVRGSR